MEENKERSYFTIDEQLFILRKRLALYHEELNTKLTNEDRQKLEGFKAEGEDKIHILESRKTALLEKPTFHLLLASDVDYKVKHRVPTYIETSDEAKYFAKSIIKQLIQDNAIELADGGYIGIIVYRSFYEKMNDSETVSSILKDRDAYVTSKEIIVSCDGISVF